MARTWNPKKIKQIAVRMDEDEKKAVEKFARDSGHDNLSDWAREVIRAAASESPDAAKVKDALLAELLSPRHRDPLGVLREFLGISKAQATRQFGDAIERLTALRTGEGKRKTS